MKMIECVIKPAKLDEVKEALGELGVYGVTAFEVKGFGRQKGRTARYRGSEMEIGFVPKVLLTMVIDDRRAEAVIETVAKAARTGEIGDGKIFVSPVEEVVRIRTGERGAEAL